MTVFIRLFALVLLLLIGGRSLGKGALQGFLGIELKDITKEEAEVLGWEAPRGIKVVNPTDAGPAANAGILPGDVILSIDGVEVENVQRLDNWRQRCRRAGAAEGVTTAPILASTKEDPLRRSSESVRCLGSCGPAQQGLTLPPLTRGRKSSSRVRRHPSS